MVKVKTMYLHFILLPEYLLYLQLLILLRGLPFSLAQENTGGSGMPNPPETKPKYDFGKLELNQESLRGSRWSVEYKGNIEVYHALELVDIARVDVDTMSIRVEFHLRQRWLVENLILPQGLFKPGDSADTYVISDQNVLNSVWSPDSYFPNARETKIASVSSAQSMVKLFSNKTITFSARISSTLGCAFNFQWYPVDTQSCELIIESYAIPTPKVIYLWEDPGKTSPVTVGELKLLQYSLHLPLVKYNDTATRFGRVDKYAQVKVRFTFERKIGQYIIQTTIPTVLVVVLSWFSFWLGLDAIPGRITLVITCMLSLVTMHNSQKKDLPPVNYVKMSDIWMVGCMAFVFTAFCEFILVKYIQWAKEAKEKIKNEIKLFQDPLPSYPPQKKVLNNRKNAQEPYIQFFEKHNIPNTDQPQRRIVDNSTSINSENYWARNKDDIYRQEEEYLGRHKRKSRRSTPIWLRIDQISRIVFPLAFGVFCATFWPLLFIGADNDSTKHY